MKVSFGDYSKKLDASVLVAMAVFKVLQEKYPSKKIAEIAETTSGGTPLRNNPEFYNGSIAWLKSGELNDGIISEIEETITELGLKNSSAKLFPKGTLLIAMYGATTGKVGILDIEATTNQAVCAIFPRNGIHRDFLFWFLRQHRYEYIRISKGGAQPNISQTLINRTEVPLPDLDEQKRIAQLLFEIENEKIVNEDLIDKEFLQEVRKFLHLKQNSDQITIELSQQLALVGQLRQTFLREAMQGKLVPQDECDERAAVLLERIKAEKSKLVAQKELKKEKPLPEIKPEEIPFDIPSNWMWCRLSDICSYIIDCPHSTPKYIEHNTGFYGIDTNCINEKGEVTRLRNLSEDSYLERVRRLIPIENDIVYSREGSIGLAAFIPANKKICLGQRVMLFRPSSEIFPEFLKFCVTETQYKNRLLEKHRGIGAKHVNVKDIVLSLVPLPPLAEQKRIVEKLETLMSFCDELENNIQQSKTQSETLLQVALKEALEPK